MYSTITKTSTYTVLDIRKAFEGFAADFRMIAARTGKMTSSTVDNYVHDVMAWAEAEYLLYVDIALIGSDGKPIKASRYSIDEKGNATQSDRAGGNNWENLPNTQLVIILDNNAAWKALTKEKQSKFMSDNNYKMSWGPSSIDNSYKHLNKNGAQLYASKGYELKKDNFN